VRAQIESLVASFQDLKPTRLAIAVEQATFQMYATCIHRAIGGLHEHSPQNITNPSPKGPAHKQLAGARNCSAMIIPIAQSIANFSPKGPAHKQFAGARNCSAQQRGESERMITYVSVVLRTARER
jgi:hypothetical protein